MIWNIHSNVLPERKKLLRTQQNHRRAIVYIHVSSMGCTKKNMYINSKQTPWMTKMIWNLYVRLLPCSLVFMHNLLICIWNRRILECYDKLLLMFIICQQSKKLITSYEEKWNIFDVISCYNWRWIIYDAL